MFCEVCGREIVGKPARALVERSTLVVCKSCAGLGTELPGFPERPRARMPNMVSHTPVRPPIEKLPRAIEETDLLEDYSRIIKQTREKMHLSQDELAFKAKEKVTLLQKIELGKMLPTMRLTKELEHILRVKLLVPKEQEEPPASIAKPPKAEATLGDVALIRRKDEQEE